MRQNSVFYSCRRQDYYLHKNNPLKYFFYHQHSQSSLHQNTQLRHHCVLAIQHTEIGCGFDILYDSFQSNHMRLFGISLISSTHSHTITNVRSTSSKVKKTTYHASIQRTINTFSFFPNKSTVSLTFGLMGVLIELADSNPKIFTRFLAYLD